MVESSLQRFPFCVALTAVTIPPVPEDAPADTGQPGRSNDRAVAHLQQELADVFPLVTLKLNHLPVLGMFDHSTITGEFLEKGVNVQHD